MVCFESLDTGKRANVLPIRTKPYISPRQYIDLTTCLRNDG